MASTSETLPILRLPTPGEATFVDVASADVLTSLAACSPVRADIGAGDGKDLLRWVKADSARAGLGVEPAADQLAPTIRAARKGLKGQEQRLLFARTSLETLPPDLAAFADLVTCLFPWGKLLRLLCHPDLAAQGVAMVASLAKPGRPVRIVINVQPFTDSALRARLDLGCDGAEAVANLTAALRTAGCAEDEDHQGKAGWAEAGSGRLTSWGARLVRGSQRTVFEWSGRAPV